MLRYSSRLLKQQGSLVNGPLLRAASARSSSTYRRQETPEYYGLRAIKKEFVRKTKDTQNPYDTEVGTWHDETWYPPGVTEYNFRTMDQWNDSPYDPPQITHDFMEETADFLLDWTHNRSKKLLMNRSEEMNSFTPRFINRLEELIFKYGNQDRTSACTFLIGRHSNAFSTGTDYLEIASLLQSVNQSDRAVARKYFMDLYSAVATAHESRVPLLTFMDGLTLGAGAALGISSSWSVATERTTIAWTEVGFGYFPDAGATFFLSKLPYHIGTYLALTGSPICSTNAVKAGLASYALDVDSIDPLRYQIEDIDGKRSPLKLLELLSWIDEKDSNPFSLRPHLKTIENCFSKDSVKEIMTALEEDGSEWAQKRLASMKTASPLSLAVTLRAIRTAEPFQNLGRSLKQDFRIAMRMLEQPDFKEGVEKRIAKDEQPTWQHASVEEVTEAEVDKFFAPFTEEEEAKYAVAGDDKQRRKFQKWRQYAVNHRERRPRQYPDVRDRLIQEIPENPEYLKALLDEMHDPVALVDGLEKQIKDDPTAVEFYRKHMKLDLKPGMEGSDSDKILASVSGVNIMASFLEEHRMDEREYKGRTWRPFSHKDAFEDVEDAVNRIDEMLGIAKMLEKDQARRVEELTAKFHAQKK